MASLCACGSVVDGGYLGKPLYTLRGSIHGSLPNVALTRPKMAVVWTSGYQGAVTVETTPLEAQFPQDFTLDVFHTPPDYEFVNFTVGSRFALGNLVAFEDVNDNGKLDTASLSVALGADVSPDRFFGYSPSDFIFVVDGEPQLTAERASQFVNPQALHRGWNLLRFCRLLPVAGYTSVLGQVFDIGAPAQLNVVPPASHITHAPAIWQLDVVAPDELAPCP